MTELSIFDPFFTGSNCFFPEHYTRRSAVPNTDVQETQKSYIITMDLPGLSQDDVEISLKDNLLTIESAKDKKEKKVEEKTNWLLHERVRAEFKRTFTMPRDINPEAISATFKNGVLTITVDRKADCAERKISIQAA